MSTGNAPASGHETRSAKTRAQLIEAAIEVIGNVGYEAASTRALASSADTTLSAIPYHFGGKKELYLAAAEAIAEYAARSFEEAGALLDVDDPAGGAIQLEKTLTHLLRFVLEDAEPHSWTSFVARCTYDNDEAFALIYDRAIGPFLDRLIQAASRISGRSPDDEALKLRIGAIVTAIISFRFLRGIMLRGMGWTTMQPGSVDQIEGMVRDLCRSDFLVA
jgi:TetR/AcrR family transcriptional regulator, regulator of cefoperazone and chloramphenicol sensitivity